MEVITSTQREINEAKSTSPQFHHGLSSPTVNDEESHDGKEDVGNPSNHNIKEDISDLVARRLENLLCIIEDDIRPTPLLKEGNDHANDQYLTIRATEQ